MIRSIRYYYRWYLFRWLAPKRFRVWSEGRIREYARLIGKQASIPPIDWDVINEICKDFPPDDTWTVWGAVNVKKKED